MRFLRTKHGQSMAEYAILFAMVIGAAVAMQQYIKSRLQAGTRAGADGYITALTTDPDLVNLNPFNDPGRKVNSSSDQSDLLVMTDASTGKRTQNVVSNTVSTVAK